MVDQPLGQQTTPVSPSPASPPSGTAESGAPVAASPNGQSETKPERPSWLPETFWDAEKGTAKGEEFGAHLKGLEELKAADEARRAGVPKEAAEYQLAVPKDFKIPEGVELNPEDPRLAAAQAFAHDAGLSQDQFAKLVAMDVQAKAAEVEAFNAAVKVRMDQTLAALGERGQERIDAVYAGLKAVVGDEGVAIAKHVLMTEQAVQMFEKLLTAGGDSFSAAGKDNPSEGKVENYDRMTPRQKIALGLAQRRAG